jgi:hypothetical protein
MMTWFVVSYFNLHPGQSNTWHGPFYGSIAAARLFTIVLRDPPLSLGQAVKVLVLKGNLWVDISSVPD